MEFFQELFKEAVIRDHADMLKNIPNIISQDENDQMAVESIIDEVKTVVNALNGDSSYGPDRFSGTFFQQCWEIMGEDVTKVVKAFFCRHMLPRFVTHTNIVLLPKTECVKSFTDLRPISLSNFINKIISRIIHERISRVLPKLISSNYTRFVNGRSISENVLLAQ